MKPALLSAEGLSLQLGDILAVDAVSLALHGGQWAAIVGPNGAGKSTLLALLAGLRQPDAGCVRLGGRPLTEWPARERARQLAWLAQQGDAEGEIAALDQLRKDVVPSMKTCLPRKASGEARVTSSDTADSSTPTTTPASSRTRGCDVPRASTRVNATPPSAPAKAAPTRPVRSSRPAVARPMNSPSRPPAASTSTTPRPAPAAEPSR